MSDNVYRVIKVTGSSTEGVDDAIRKAVSATSDDVGPVEWVEVQSIRGHCADGQLEHFQVTLDVGYRSGEKATA